jgi:tetratricopeptide (TPR) repeat protein
MRNHFSKTHPVWLAHLIIFSFAGESLFAQNDASEHNPIVLTLKRRAEALGQEGAYEAVLSLCDRIEMFVKNDPEVFMFRANALGHLNRLTEANAALEKVAAIDPGFPSIQLSLGNAALLLKDYIKALGHFQVAEAAITPSTPASEKVLISMQIGRIHKHLGDVEKSLLTFSEVVQFAPEYPEAYVERGQLYLDEGEYEYALADFQQALKLDPGNAQYSYHVGKLLFLLDKGESAIAYLQTARQKMPGFYGIYYNLGRSLLSAGRSEEGELYLSIADSLYKRSQVLGTAKTAAETRNTRESWLTYANMLYQDRLYQEALPAYQMALNLGPSDAAIKQRVEELKGLLRQK